MIEWLNNIDIELMLFLNSTHCPYLDNAFWLISGKLTWLPVYMTVIVIMALRNWKNALILLAMTGILILLADQISSGIIKPLVERPRPSHNPLIEDLLHYVNDYRGGRFGFVSSHAANTIAFAMFYALIFGTRTLALVGVIWALLVSYSRIYLGVHYPGDILGGLIIGIFAAIVTFYFYRRIVKISSIQTLCNIPFTHSDAIIVAWSIIITTSSLFAIAIFI